MNSFLPIHFPNDTIQTADNRHCVTHAVSAQKFQEYLQVHKGRPPHLGSPGIFTAIAYAVYGFVPLSYAQDMQALGLADPMIQGQRLRLFCQAYGLMHSYEEVLDTVVRRLEALCILLNVRVHDPIYQKMIAEGHLDHYRREIASLGQYRTRLQHGLLL